MLWYCTLMMLNSIASLRIAFRLRGHRQMPGRNAAVVAMIAAAIWSISVLAQLTLGSLAALIMGSLVASLARTVFSTSLVYALLAYTGASRGAHARQITSVLRFTSLLLMAVLLFQMATNPALHLWSSGIAVAHAGDLTLLLVYPGVGRLFFERLGYVVTVLSCVQSLRALLQTSNTQRRAARPILIGVGGTLFMLLGLRLLYGDALFPVVYHTDISVIAFGILTLSRGIDRYRPFAIMPIGRKLAIEQLDDGLLVFDSYGCIVEANPAAVRILGWRADDLDRQVLKAIHPALGEALADAHSGPTDIVLGPLGRTYELRRSEIRQGDEAVGILLRLQDVTENRRLLGELRRLATEDGLTGTMNRRYFLELFQREAAASQATPMALLLFDVDHFKSVNDTYGHKVGDQVLVALVARVSGALRAGDLLGRYGGEEFIVLAHQVNPDAAARLAERLRHAIGSAPMATSVGDVLVTVSVGVAAWDGVGQLDIDAMIQEADCALYVAKEAGRNRVHAAWEHMPEIMRS